MTTSQDSPVRDADRIVHLDVIRGISVLGILLMNIMSFGLTVYAYSNPSILPEFDGVDLIAWMFANIFAEQKFMTLFSLLYGAGMWLFCKRVAEKGHKPFRLFKRRSLWLMLFGLLHAYLIWYGDILFTYGICGFLVFKALKWRPRTQLVIGCLLLMVPIAFKAGIGFSVNFMTEEEVLEMKAGWEPPQEELDAELEAFRGSWIEQIERRALLAVFLQTAVVLIYSLWRAAGLMLIGMALMQLGLLSGQWSRGFYTKLALVGLSVGLLLGCYACYELVASDFAFPDAMTFTRNYIMLASLFMAAGYLGLIMLIPRGLFSDYMAAAGRMAFSNYLGQSLICTTIFYGHGFGWFGYLGHAQLMLVAVGVWVFQLAFSKWWLTHYRFGPGEWAWRCLTYKTLQPIRRTQG